MTINIPFDARLLDFAGLLPQAIALALVLNGDPGTTFAAQSLAFAYAALIFSFLGGIWWGLAAAANHPPRWIWIAAVGPSLLALASCIPWATAGEWPGPSLLLLGALLTASLLVDRKLLRAALVPAWWMQLRAPLSIGLGAMTFLLGLLSMR